MNIAVILAAGAGTRLNSSLSKQYLKIGDSWLLDFSLKTFSSCSSIDRIVLVVDSLHLDLCKEHLLELGLKRVEVTEGGSTRSSSVKNALNHIKKEAKDDDLILIHDSARPNVSVSLIEENIKVAKEFSVAITALDSYDTLFELDSNEEVKRVLPRERVKRIQTPQTFTLKLLAAAHEKNDDRSISDDSQLVSRLVKLHFVKGSEDNYKITTMEDLHRFCKDKEDKTI